MKVLLVVALCGLAAAALVSADDAAAAHDDGDAAAAHADDAAAANTCGLLERIKIRRQWTTAFGEGTHRLEFAHDLFSNLFKAYPAARELFKKWRGDNIYSPEFQAFAQRLLSKFGLLIATTDDQPALDVLVESAKTQYAEKGIKPEYLEAFRDELLETLPKYLGTHLDWDAWRDCLNALIHSLH